MSSSLHNSKKRLRAILTHVPLRMRASRATGRTSIVTIDGFTLKVPEGVFHPQFFYSSRILIEELRRIDLAGRQVLDMGTGSGILALAAARRGATVLAVDVNPAAAKAASANAEANGLAGRVSVRTSDLFAGVGDEKFDVIVWNPPFYPKPPLHPARAAWDAGDSYEVIRRFAASAASHLHRGGKCILIFSSDMDIPMIIGMFTLHGFRTSTLNTYRRFLESFEVHSFSLRESS